MACSILWTCVTEQFNDIYIQVYVLDFLSYQYDLRLHTFKAMFWNLNWKSNRQEFLVLVTLHVATGRKWKWWATILTVYWITKVKSMMAVLWMIDFIWNYDFIERNHDRNRKNNPKLTGMNIQFCCFTFFDKKNNQNGTHFLILLSQLIQFSHFSDIFIPITSLLSTTVVAFLPFYFSFSLHFLLSLFPLSFNYAFLNFNFPLRQGNQNKKACGLHWVVTWVTSMHNVQPNDAKTRGFWSYYYFSITLIWPMNVFQVFFILDVLVLYK